MTVTDRQLIQLQQTADGIGDDRTWDDCEVALGRTAPYPGDTKQAARARCADAVIAQAQTWGQLADRPPVTLGDYEAVADRVRTLEDTAHRKAALQILASTLRRISWAPTIRRAARDLAFELDAAAANIPGERDSIEPIPTPTSRVDW